VPPSTCPSGPALVERVGAVAAIARLAFTAGYAPGSGADVLRPDVAGEAIRLVRVLRVTLAASGATVPDDLARDLDALLALMLLQHARRDARVRYDGDRPRLVLLPDQDRSAGAPTRSARRSTCSGRTCSRPARRTFSRR
jgi:RNA polymerase sigma-70 factor (ECF subfamily)